MGPLSQNRSSFTDTFPSTRRGTEDPRKCKDIKRGQPAREDDKMSDDSGLGDAQYRMAEFPDDYSGYAASSR